MLVLGARGLDPDILGIAPILPLDRPRACQRMVDGGDLQVEEARIGLVEGYLLLDDGLAVLVHRNAAGLEGTVRFQAAGLDQERVEASLAALVHPGADRI